MNLNVTLMVTGWKCGELVFRYGLGVMSLPKAAEGNPGNSHDHNLEENGHGSGH